MTGGPMMEVAAMTRRVWITILVVIAAVAAMGQVKRLPGVLATSLSSAAWGSGTAALAYVDADTVQVVDRDTGAVPTTTDPVLVTIGGQVYVATAAVTATWTAIDTGAEAVGTQYYVFAVPSGSNFTLKISASKAAPTITGGYRLLGSFHNSPTGSILSGSVWSLAKGERDLDGMVKVGAWWVDIYEASIWDASAYGTGTQLGASSDNYAGCADTGAGCTAVFAQSRYNVTPSRYATQFQWAAACASSGKELISNALWQVQAMGTTEVVSKSVTALTSVGTTATATITGHGYGSAGATRAVIINGATQTEYNGAYTVTVSDANTVTYTFAGSATSPATGSITVQNRTDCIVNAAAPYATGTATSCVSAYGTYDNVGNLWEWASDWFAGTRSAVTPANESPGTGTTWGPGLIDYVYNVRGAAYADGNGSGYKDGLPAAPIRGGYWNSGANAGVFTLGLYHSPWSVSNGIGGRCARQ
jgi:hypothetical protein